MSGLTGLTSSLAPLPFTTVLTRPRGLLGRLSLCRIILRSAMEVAPLGIHPPRGNGLVNSPLWLPRIPVRQLTGLWPRLPTLVAVILASRSGRRVTIRAPLSLRKRCAWTPRATPTTTETSPCPTGGQPPLTSVLRT